MGNKFEEKRISVIESVRSNLKRHACILKSPGFPKSRLFFELCL